MSQKTPRTDEIEFQWIGYAHTGDRKPAMTMAEHARALELGLAETEGYPGIAHDFETLKLECARLTQEKAELVSALRNSAAALRYALSAMPHNDLLYLKVDATEKSVSAVLAKAKP